MKDFGNDHVSGASGPAIMSKTLAKPTSELAGVGLHTGESSRIRVLPAVTPCGIVFRRYGSSKETQAVAANIAGTDRCTALSVDGGALSTVEHLMSAMSGLGITDAVVEYDGFEVPIMDGSSRDFMTALADAGVVEVGGTTVPIRMAQPLTLLGPGGGIVTAVPSDHLWITVVLDYPDKPLMQPQAATFTGTNYEVDISSARTFGFVAELEYLARMGLAKGASRENAFVLNADGTADPETPLRFANEPARHKVLDIIGDLVFAGKPVHAGIVAFRPSHTLNIKLAAELSKVGGSNEGE